VSFSKPAAFCVLLLTSISALFFAQELTAPKRVFGYRDFSAQAKIDQEFLAIPDPKLAQQELKALTAAPHVAGSKEDYATAVYVADKFKAAGLETQIVEYTAWMNLPKEIYLHATAADGSVLLSGPSPEHVEGDPFQNDPRVLPGFNGSSPSGDVTGDVVYVNYGRPEDYKKLDALHVDVRGKLVIARYGANFRGVKVYVAQQHGAIGVIIYSDPADDGYFQGDPYPNGPWRPETGIQRGSVQYLFKYPGDATTPGIASTPDLPQSKRLPLSQVSDLPTIPSMPLSYRDAAPILRRLAGPAAPRDWQGALPFSYHVGGANAVTVHMRLKMDYAQRPIWDVVGKIEGSESPDDWVVTGNHRDAWVYGAVDPNSGTVAMLEAVHGIGALLAKGWKPKRTLYFCSWDAEEEGLIGSTEWAEDHAKELEKAVAYFNTDVAVSGPHFESAAVPSLKQFVREVTMEVPSPGGGSVYEQWRQDQAAAAIRQRAGNPFSETPAVPQANGDASVNDLGSGSDYTPFLQHIGVPSTDIGSVGPYGVYHSVFDNYAWFIKNADPSFLYEQEMARILGLEALHMADADVLPYDYAAYGKQILTYIDSAELRAKNEGLAELDFASVQKAGDRFTAAATAVRKRQLDDKKNFSALNASLRETESDLLSPEGLPGRPWFKHTIYAPGEYTGYAAVVIPGVNEAIDAHDAARAQMQINDLAAALNRAATTLEPLR
jgi:N-acetylated-alpha-linked acidic dipeptidase